MALDTRKIPLVENGITSQVSALSPKWCEEKHFLNFILPPPITALDMEDWKETMNYYIADLHWLLKLPHHKFWSQMIYDKSLQSSLVSFLQEAPRFYSKDHNTIIQADCWELYQQSYNLVFLAFVRLATHKESKDNYITPEVFGSLLYENFMFDIPKLMDLSILFGPTNQVLLNKMITNIFTHQPKYSYDLDEAVNGFFQVFDLLLGQLGLDDKQATGWDSTAPLSPDELNDVINYIVDVSATIWYFLEVYPPAATNLSSANLQNKLAEFYEKAVPYLCQQIEDVESPEKVQLIEALNLSRKYLIQDYNTLLHSVSIRPLLGENCIDKQSCTEQWLEWLTCIMGERHFIVDYNFIFPLQDDIDLMTQLSITLDSTRVDYVLNGMKSIIVEFGLSSYPRQPQLGFTEQSADLVNDMAIGPLIMQVKELLPDLDDDFVQACLKHYDFNPESVINSILEGNLAPHLIEMQNNPPLPVEVRPEQEMFPSLITEVKDISKKSRTKTVHFDEMREVLDDKQNLKSIILERAVEQMISEFDEEYDDEYDDTYDGHAMGAEEPDAHSELENRRSFVVPRVLRPKEELEYEEEEEEEIIEKPKDQFVPNPAELREQAEQRRLSKRGGNRQSAAVPRPPRDVVGAPRGQGQDKDTLIARRHKMENKSRGANHSRRSQADRKRREF